MPHPMSDPRWPGPEYTISSPTLRKFRRKAREGLATLSRAERNAYGKAVQAAVLAAQAAQLRGHGESMPRSNCASGTFHNTGEAIHAAVAAQHRAETQSWPGKIRRARSPEEWQELYDAAMAEKRERAKPSVAA